MNGTFPTHGRGDSIASSVRSRSINGNFISASIEEGLYSKVIARADHGQKPLAYTRLQREAALKEQLPEDLTTAWGNNEAGSIGFKVKLGKALRNRAGTQFGVDGLHLNRDGTERKGGQGRWRVLAGMQGSQGSNLSKSRSAEDQHGRNNPANPATLHDEDGPRSEGGVEPPGKLLNNENPANAPCFVCKGTTFRALRNGGWVCEVCQPEGVQKSGHEQHSPGASEIL